VTLWGILDNRSHRGSGWIWTDSITYSRRSANDKLLEFWSELPAVKGKTRKQALRNLHRWGLRAVKVRVEVVA